MAQSIESPALDAEISWLDAEVEVSRATYQAYQIMYYAFITLTAVAGLDKFFRRLDPALDAGRSHIAGRTH